MIPLVSTLNWFISLIILIFALGVGYSFFIDDPTDDKYHYNIIPSYGGLAILSMGISAIITMIKLVIQVVIYDEIE